MGGKGWEGAGGAMDLAMSRTARAELPNCWKWWHCNRAHDGRARISSVMPAKLVKRRLPQQMKPM
jgi:hypothetical protein